MKLSHNLFMHAPAVWFNFKNTPQIEKELEGLSVDEMAGIEWPAGFVQENIPLGALVLPSLRWALRRHNLIDDEGTRFLFRQYILSAYHLALEFAFFLDKIDPECLVIFNGIMYPEGVTRWTGLKKGYRVITHEVGFEPFSAFFCEGQATAYPIKIPESFELNPEQNDRLDQYLSRRFQGDFSMAGIRFWPEMKGLDQDIIQKMSRYRQVVSIFTNVIYDTSQIHANVVFPHMFAWLDTTLEMIKRHTDTLFVIRAHPDEMRPGTRKQSRESVRAWIDEHQVCNFPNVIFIDSQEYISSYQLIGKSKFVMVYNSSIGLEATLLGKPVLCAGKARYTQYPTVFFPQTIDAYQKMAGEFLDGDMPDLPAEFVRNARRFLYYQLFKVSLSYESYLNPARRAGFVRLGRINANDLDVQRSPAIRTVIDGIQNRNPFILTD